MRRVTAVTGREAVATVQRLSSVVDDLASRFNCKPEEVPRRVEVLAGGSQEAADAAQEGRGRATWPAPAIKLLAEASDAGGAKIIVGEMPAGADRADAAAARPAAQKAGAAVVVLGWADEGKVGLLTAVTDDLVKKGLHAGKLVGEVAKVVGGKGGGPPTGIAQAGGKDADKLGEALQLAQKLAIEKLSAAS